LNVADQVSKVTASPEGPDQLTVSIVTITI